MQAGSAAAAVRGGRFGGVAPAPLVDADKVAPRGVRTGTVDQDDRRVTLGARGDRGRTLVPVEVAGGVGHGFLPGSG